MGERITLLDVAAAAGVSRATASRVLAGIERNVHPELARRVLAASHQLGYRANPVARALRRRHTGNFGILVPSIRDPHFGQLVHAFVDATSAAGLGVVLADSASDPAAEAARIEALHESFVDGIVVVPASMTRNGAAIRSAAERGGVIQVDRWTKGAECGFVGVDNEAAVELLLDHLRATGRNRVAFLGAERESSTGVERLTAFRKRARPGDTEIFTEIRGAGSPGSAASAGREVARQLLNQPSLPDAALCATDTLAVGLLSALHREGIRVPEDIAITGFDGTELLELVDPPITGLRHPLRRIAGHALEVLLGKRPADQARFAPELVVRDSS